MNTMRSGRHDRAPCQHLCNKHCKFHPQCREQSTASKPHTYIFEVIAQYYKIIEFITKQLRELQSICMILVLIHCQAVQVLFCLFYHIVNAQILDIQVYEVQFNRLIIQNSNQMRDSKVKSNDNVRVVVRVRPPLTRQLEGEIFISTVQVHNDRKRIQLFEYYHLDSLNPDDLELYIDNPSNYLKHQFTFDHVYDDEAEQQEIYNTTARLSVCSALEGYNATIFAYGQTGTGKTYTMEGFKYNLHDQERGIIPRAIEDIFKYIQSCQDEETKFMVRASYIQIYNEVISDLLRHEKNNLQIREDSKKGVYVEGVSEWAVVRPEEIMELIKMGARSRATAKTNMNELSSRSHAVFIITIEQMSENLTQREGKQIKVAKLNLVDLAGSERVRVTGASGKRLDECKNINRSLSCLGMVISALTENKTPTHIPYRNSLLTRLLSDSLGGNCKTTMFTMISPAPEAFHESLSSLKFAHRAKSIKNKPAINEDLDQKALIRKYENELKKLRNQLEQKNKVLIDKTKLVQLEQLQEEKKKIEEDKNNVMIALQQRSKQFFKEREEKKKLEEKIKAFNSQIIQGGGFNLENTIAEHQKVIKQYENKIRNLESEKRLSGQDGYNSQLFNKQNTILMSLAAKLNERDEVNMHLNEELCAYDRITKETEEMLEKKIKRVEVLEALLKTNKIPIPAQQSNYFVEKMRDKDSEKVDGVCLEGETTYNITSKNLRFAEQQINTLKEQNGQQKQQISRLKEELMKKDSFSMSSVKSVMNTSGSNYPPSEHESQQKTDLASFRNIKDSIDKITKGLQSKQNINMKQIINQIYKIKQVVAEKIDQNTLY